MELVAWICRLSRFLKGEKMPRSVLSSSSRDRRAVARWLLLSYAVAGASCGTGDATGPGGRSPPPALEPVAYEAVGSGKVMFQRIGNDGAFTAVHVIDADARRTTTALDTVSSIVFGASLSPSGEAVAGLLWTDWDSCYDVYVTDLSGGHKKRLSSFSCNSEGPPAWAPDGSEVVFVVQEGYLPSSAWGIYRGEVASGASWALRTFAVDTAGWIGCPAASRVLASGQVSVSVQGGLAYICGRDIWGADRPSDALAALRRGDSLATMAAVAWSPDGDALAFIEVSYGAGSVASSSLRVQDRASGVVRPVATVPGSGSSSWHGSGPASLCWLPGGTRIVFSAPDTGVTSDEPMRASLYVVGADGTGLVRLTTAPDAFDSDVSCSR